MNEWKTVQINEIADVIMGQSPSSTSYNNQGVGYPFLQGCSEFGKRIPIVKFYCSAPKKIVPENSILISVRAPVGTTNRANFEYCIGRGLAGIYGRSINQDFLYYKIVQHTQNLERVSQGSTFLAICTNDLNTLKINIPTSLSEQRKIARILSTVDAVIEKTEAAIAKYKNIKAGMMHDLFTRGIDLTTGKLRPSYEEAPKLYKQSELGWVPKEWEMATIENVSNRIWIGLVTTMTTHYVEFGIPLIRNSNIKDSEIDSSDIIYLDDVFSEQNKQRYLHNGDIVTVHTGDIGTSAIITKELDPSHGFATINTTVNPKQIFNSYLCDYFNTLIFKNRIEAYATGDGRNNFNLYDYLYIDIPFPKKTEEQKLISEKLNLLRKLIKKENICLKKYQQLKQALMSDLLTGKVRVKYEK